MSNLADYYATKIKINQVEYILGHRGKITDEGSFYRIDDTFIVDKCKIKKIALNKNEIVIDLDNKKIMLTVTKCREN